MSDSPNLICGQLLSGIRQWLERGGTADWNDNPSGWSFFHFAAEDSDIEAIEYLFALGCDINAHDQYGQTPLHLAIDADIDGSNQNGGPIDFQPTRRLIELGADLTIQDKEGKTPLDWVDVYGKYARASFDKMLSEISPMPGERTPDGRRKD
jgi:ankyrin repeat protein